ncbi:MAG TPA: alpha/beta hydrolase [Rhizomicrobium sp.]
MANSQTPADYESEYNNRARVPEHPQIMAGWLRDAAAYREARPPERIAYGARPREMLDLFGPSEGPVILFIHGGYWQALDGSSFSHMARGLNARGIAVAVATYDLCPDVPIAAIVEQIRLAARVLHRRTGRRVIAVGHSAGGHLAACLLATDWRSVDRELPAQLVPAACCLSGLFDLRPLVETQINRALKLDPAEAKRLSPLFWTPPRDAKLHAAVGELESSEYHRQSREIVERWRTACVETTFESIAGANHFTVIAPLADPDSKIVADIAGLAEAAV